MCSPEIHYGVDQSANALAGCAEDNCPELRLASRPSALQHVREHCGADGTPKMVPPFAPINTRSAEWALLLLDCCDIHAPAREKPASLAGQIDDIGPPAQDRGRDPSIEHIDRETTREVIVARSGMVHGFVFGPRTRAHVARPRRNSDQGFDEMRHICIRDAKVSKASLPGADENTRRFELA
jgi:hypothetical protein